MADLLAIGEALIELNQPREGAPFVQGFGGDTSNAMIAAARLGADAAYFTAVGADAFGQALAELWRREGVDASRIVGEPDQRRRPAGGPHPRNENSACLGHQPGDLVFSRGRGVRGYRRGPRRQAACLLRSEPEAKALAAAP